MAIRIEAHAEPIPGYRLIERLGSGGFGEVWKAEAPGGLFKAIKFVQRGTSKETESSIIGGSVPERSRADQEWKSLMRVKSVRHPFILLLDRFENIDNFLVIVMELADRTLADRFKECRSHGLPGVPRDELLSYMAEAAEVLDLMNAQYQLQHLDIKPQNLFLVHNHIKVADFGLVKDTTNGKDLMTITGGVTPVYAAPETFDGQFSRQSDQYSLAIVYQEMLTGMRPFTGTTMKQLVLQHLQNAFDLTPAPVNDRPVLARALAKNPEDRFLTCVDFVQALAKATYKTTPGAENAEAASPGQPFVAHKTVVSRGAAGPVKPAEPNFSVEEAFLTDGGKSPNGNSDPARGPARSMPMPTSEPLGKSARTPNVRFKRKAKEKQASTHELPGIVQPALVVGLGQLGVETLARFKREVTMALGSFNAIPKVRVLGIDTDPEAVQRAIHSDTSYSLTGQEMLLTRLQRPSQYLRTRDGKLPTDHWLNPKFLHRIPREHGGAGLRALGRLAFVDNYRGIAKRLEVELHALCSQDTPYAHTPYHDLGVRTTCPRVYVVTSLSGNTGGGMFLDLAYLLRRLLNEMGQEEAEIIGAFYLPAVKREPAYGPAMANTFAALVELQHYSQPEALFSAHYETGASMTKGERVSTCGPAFERCLLVPLPESKARPSEADNVAAVARVSSFLYRDLATVLGQAFDAQRLSRIQQGDTLGNEPLLHSVGMYRIHWPRHQLLEQASRRLCGRLLEHWMNKDAQPLADTLRQWTHERWEALNMRSENLIEHFQEQSEQCLGKKSEIVLAEILAPIQKALGDPADAKAPKNFRLASVVEGMERLEQTIGLTEECHAAKGIHVEPSLLEKTFENIALRLADECEQKLAQLAVQLLEDPNYRLAGAEESLRQFCAIVDQALQSQETLAKELNDRATLLYQRIQQLVEVPLQGSAQSSSQRSNANARRAKTLPGGASTNDLFELIRTYAKTRYHGLVLAYLNHLYLSLRGHLSDQIREVGFCRQRLGELLGLVQPADAKVKVEPAPDERVLFPAGCIDLADAVEQLLQAVSRDDLLDFDACAQAWIEEHCEALLQICMGSSTTVKNVASGILQEAEAYLGSRLQGNSVAQMYLSRKRAEYDDESFADLIKDDLQCCLDDATPEIGRIAPHGDVAIASLPDDPDGKEIQDLLREQHRDLTILLSDRQDEILFYHEIIRIQWKHLEQLGPVAREAYQQRGAVDPASLHTREDVFDWQILSAGAER